MLANLFLHYALDAWMARTYPAVKFERFVDDVVVHCSSERQALRLQAAIGERLALGRSPTIAWDGAAWSDPHSRWALVCFGLGEILGRCAT